MKRWLQIDFFYKAILFISLYSLISIFIGLILLLINSSWIYGILIGIVSIFLSYFLIWMFWYKISFTKKFASKSTPWLSPLLRIVLFTGVYCFIIFYINPSLDSSNVGLDKALYPINTIALLLTYTIIPFLGYITIWITDSIVKKNIIKERSK